MKKVLIIWLWWQWKKYLNYFIKNNYIVSWVCKTSKTKEYIEETYWIDIFLDYWKLILNNYDLIIVSLPPEIQWEISLDILGSWYNNKLIIEIPVTWNKSELQKIKSYKNAYFYLEEYYTLLSKFLRKINLSKSTSINIDITTSKEDYDNLKARNVSFIHINNNFLWLNFDNIKYNFNFHDREDIFYKITFVYKNNIVEYVFNDEKYLKIWKSIFKDDYNFDKVLWQIIEEENNFSNSYQL